MCYFFRVSWWTSAYFSRKNTLRVPSRLKQPLTSSKSLRYTASIYIYIYIHDINIYIYIHMYNIHPDISIYIHAHLYLYIYIISIIIIIIIPILFLPKAWKNPRNLPNNPSCLTIWVSSWVKPWLPCGSCAWCVWYGSWSQGAPAGWSHGCFLHIYFHFFHLSRPFIATFSPRLVNPKGSE